MLRGVPFWQLKLSLPLVLLAVAQRGSFCMCNSTLRRAMQACGGSYTLCESGPVGANLTSVKDTQFNLASPLKEAMHQLHKNISASGQCHKLVKQGTPALVLHMPMTLP